MITPRSRSARSTAPALLCLIILIAAGCGEDVVIPNQDARIEAVGNLAPPIEACGIEVTAAQELSVDAGTDADSGSGSDAGFDAGTDAADSPDAGADAGLDAGDSPDAGADAGLDAGLDAGNSPDAGADAGSDAGDSPDAGSTPSFQSQLSRDGDSLSIPYLIIDREADDQNIRVEICTWDGSAAGECGVAVAGPGGDGTNLVPTSPAGSCVLHVFNWDVGCGRFTGVEGGSAPPQRVQVEGGQELVARISVIGSNETPSQSEPFTLKALGFDALPPCD